MKIATIKAPRKSGIIEVPQPKAKNEYVVVKILTAPMCTEYKTYRDGTPTDCLGHEAAGEVVEVDKSSLVKKGDRVVVMPQYPCGTCSLCKTGDYIHCENNVDPLQICDCEYGIATYAQYMVKSDKLLIPVPHDLSIDEASMACCGLGSTFGAVHDMQIGDADTVLITGLGPVGLGAIINCVTRGANVIAVARNEYRKKLAADLGAQLILDPNDPELYPNIRKTTQNKGADKAIECSGASLYQKICIEGVRRKGIVSFVGESGELPVAISDQLIRKGLTLTGSWHWNINLTSEMLDTIRRSKSSIKKLVTHIFPMEQMEEAFKLQEKGNCGKILLKPWD
jgi:L-iditol 2-dehydrogenase